MAIAVVLKGKTSNVIRYCTGTFKSLLFFVSRYYFALFRYLFFCPGEDGEDYNVCYVSEQDKMSLKCSLFNHLLIHFPHM